MINNLIDIYQILKYIKKNKVTDVVFADSYGGMIGLFQLFEIFQIKKKRNIVICNNKTVNNYLQNNKKFFSNQIFYISYEKYYLKNLIFQVYTLFFTLMRVKVNNIYTYKLSADVTRIYLSNILSNNRTKLKIIDTFHKSYKPVKKKKKIKHFLINKMNFFFKFKIFFYDYSDIFSNEVLCFNNKFLIKPPKKYSWAFFKKKIFTKKKYKIKKNSMVIIDEATNELGRLGLINFEKSKVIILDKIINFIKKNNIKCIYIKSHPTSRVKNLMLNYKNIKIKFIKSLDPMEFFLDSFKYCMFSVSSSLFMLNTKTKLICFINLYCYTGNNNRKIVRSFFKKNIGLNFKKTFFLKK